jgi:hypothetical protein
MNMKNSVVKGLVISGLLLGLPVFLAVSGLLVSCDDKMDTAKTVDPKYRGDWQYDDYKDHILTLTEKTLYGTTDGDRDPVEYDRRVYTEGEILYEENGDSFEEFGRFPTDTTLTLTARGASSSLTKIP